MRVLVFSLCLIFIHGNAWAIDLSKYKEKLRSHMANMLGEDTTNSILGEAPDTNKDQIELPDIPKVNIDAKNEKFYDKKKTKLHEQGEKYNSLSLEEKRAYRISFLEQLFKVTRNSEAKKSDIVKGLNVLEQGGSREGVYRSVVLDRVYLALEQYDEEPSEALINFVLDYSSRFMAITYKPESLLEFNLWSLKRIITDKTLEIIDEMDQKPDHVYRWYAVFSKELAKKYPNAWNSKTRKKQLDLYHYKWAQTVPFQHIKSEVILKLHKVMNGLQRVN